MVQSETGTKLQAVTVAYRKSREVARFAQLAFSWQNHTGGTVFRKEGLPDAQG
jgi:hypothetical protein